MKYKFKLIMPLLVLFMIVLVPNVFAATTVNSKSAFKTACQDATIDVIKLGTDIEITNEDYNNSYPFLIDGINRTLDLNGHNLTISKSIGNEYGFVVRVSSTGKTLNITNSKSTGEIFNNTSHALFEIYNNDITDFTVNVHDITIQGRSSQLFDSSKDENVNLNVNNVNAYTNTASGSLYFFFSDMKATIRNFTLTRNDTRGSVYICTNWDKSLAKDVIGDSDVYYDDDKQEITDSTYLYEVYPTTGYKTVSIRDKQYTYAAELEDMNLGTATEGYTPTDYQQIFRMRNTGTEEINASSNYFKTELTSGNISAFDIWTNNGGYFQSGNSYNAGSIKPKENLTPGSYTAGYTAYYDRDGSGTDFGWEALDNATVSFTVTEKEPVYHTVTFYSNINLGNKLPAPTQVKEGEYVPIETMLSIPMVYNGYSLEGMYSDSTYTTPAENSQIYANTDYYLKYVKISEDNLINEIDISFTEPLEGTSTTTPKDGDVYNLLEQENKPQVTIDENDNYYLYNTYWVEGTTEDKIRIPFTGTFDSSKEYYCYVEVDNKIDKYVVNDFTFKVNGQVTNMEYFEVLPFSTRIIFKVTPKKNLNIIHEIRVNSQTTSVKTGALPEFSVTSSTEHISIEGYGSNTVWVKNILLNQDSWWGFGGETPAAEIGETHYGLRLHVELEEGYSFGENVSIYFNGIDITKDELTYFNTGFSWGGYLYIDLGTATKAIIKGDMNADGFINSTDAAMVLDKFKNNNATAEDFARGDMDNNNILNATDAAMILDIFKNS